MSETNAIDAPTPKLTTPLPTQDELPYEDGIPMETERHKHQMDLLIYPLKPWLRQRAGGGYVSGNMFVYFSLEQARNQDFRGPDVFVVLGVPARERKSWVVWEEGKGPDVVIELLSEQTAAKDKGEKKTVYQNQLKVAEYFWFDPFNPEDWAGFSLCSDEYKTIAPDDKGRLPCACLELMLVRWYGSYEGVETTWLRWALPSGELLPTAQEAFEAAQQQAAAAQQQAAAAQQQAAAAQQQATAARQQATAAQQQATAETQRADAEARRAAEAEAELARLRALLADKG